MGFARETVGTFGNVSVSDLGRIPRLRCFTCFEVEMSEIFLFSGVTKVELADFSPLVRISSLVDRSHLSMTSKDSWLVQCAFRDLLRFMCL